MNKDLERFENRSDDWLAKQKKIEDNVSAWDFDEGKKIKETHEKNCEAKEIKERHEKIHSGQIKSRKKNGGSVFAIILIIMVAVELIPTIIVSGETEVIPISIICIIMFVLAMVSILKKGNK